MNKEQQLREAIIKAVPEIMEEGEYINDFRNPIGRPITLTDVLRAIDHPEIMVDVYGRFLMNVRPVPLCQEAQWNLKEPLSNQSQETKHFLYNLLVEHE